MECEKNVKKLQVETTLKDVAFCVEILEGIIYFVTEEYGRDFVHLFPGEFRSFTQEDEIPDVLETGVKESIGILGDLIGCESYPISLFEFWILDVISDGLIKAQIQKMTQANQKVLVNWFCYFFKKLEDKDDHKTFLETMEMFFYAAEEFVEENKGRMPSLNELEQILEVEKDDFNEHIIGPYHEKENGKSTFLNKEKGNGEKYCAEKEKSSNDKNEKNKNQSLEIVQKFPINSKYLTGIYNKEPLILDGLNALIKISAILQNIFGDEFIFMLLSGIFGKRPLCLDVYSPYTINKPKPILLYHDIFKPKPEVHTPAKDKKDNQKNKSKKEEEIMEETQKVQEPEEEEIDLRDVILPLQMAVDVTFFEDLWPPAEEIIVSSNDKGKKPK